VSSAVNQPVQGLFSQVSLGIVLARVVDKVDGVLIHEVARRRITAVA
jgi:hypothetical protein